MPCRRKRDHPRIVTSCRHCCSRCCRCPLQKMMMTTTMTMGGHDDNGDHYHWKNIVSDLESPRTVSSFVVFSTALYVCRGVEAIELNGLQLLLTRGYDRGWSSRAMMMPIKKRGGAQDLFETRWWGAVLVTQDIKQSRSVG